jgi:membrane protease YdiL (CAAX protease family)
MSVPGRAAAWAIPVALAPLVAIGMLDGLYKPALYAATPAGFWFADAAKFVVLPAIALAWLARVANVRPRDYGLRWPRSRAQRTELARATLLAVLALPLLYQVAATVLWQLPFDDAAPAFGYGTTLAPDGWLRWAGIAYFALTAGVVEEILFRGLPWLWLSAWPRVAARRSVYVLGTSIVFAATHWENGIPELASTFAYGTAAAMLYLRLGSLWPLVVAHIVTDLVVLA